EESADGLERRFECVEEAAALLLLRGVGACLCAASGDDVGRCVAVAFVALRLPERGRADDECERDEDEYDPARVHNFLPLHLAERVYEVEGRGAEDDDEERREQKAREREEQLDRRLLRGLLGALPTLRAQRVGVDAHGARYR